MLRFVFAGLIALAPIAAAAQTEQQQVVDRASLAVQYVFLFTLAAGLTVLLAAIQSTRDERRYESAMLRTLGASRRVVLTGVASEFTALGMLAGVLAAIGATIVGWVLATQLFDLMEKFAEYGFNKSHTAAYAVVT